MEGNLIHNSTTQKDDYDAPEEKIRLNYRRLALKWHPDKHNGDSAVTAKFQEINEAYEVQLMSHIQHLQPLEISSVFHLLYLQET